jgi:acetyltransferase AlgX (SGNH hydrolase-like protein)
MTLRTREVQVLERFRSPLIDHQGRGNFEAAADPGGVTISGWALGRERTAVAVEALDKDGAVLARVPILLERPDVVLWVGDVPGAARSGFKIRLEPRRSGESAITLQVVFDDAADPVMLGTLILTAELEGREEEDGSDWVVAVDKAARSRVLEGRDGWLFLQGDRNDALGQHTGRITFDVRQLADLRRLMSRRREMAAASGATWLTAVVPDKEMVYADYLPPEIALVDRRPIHDYLDVAAEVGVPVIYMLQEMRNAATAGDVYMRTDTHWNYRGAFVAYLAICEQLQALGIDLDIMDEDWIEWSEVPKQGDLGSKLYPEVVEGSNLLASIFPSFGRLVYDNQVRNHGRVLIHEQEDQSRPTCLVFGESFGPNLLFFLKESFRRLVFVHSSMLIPELIELERPDVVISLPIERFLIRVPNDFDALSKLRETVDAKGGELPEAWSLD